MRAFVDYGAHVTAKATGKTLQPNSRSCFVCGLDNPTALGLRFYQTGEGEVTAETVVPNRFQGYPGIVHGGVVAAMLDEIAGRAAMGDQLDRFMFTAKITVSYRKPVPLGQPLRLTGRLVRRRGRLALVTGELRLADGTLAADAEATLADVPEPRADPAVLEALGWKVYPDPLPDAEPVRGAATEIDARRSG